MVLCHTDAHGWNLIQSNKLVLVDWEGLRLAPPEADLNMFTKKRILGYFSGELHQLPTKFQIRRKYTVVLYFKKKD